MDENRKKALSAALSQIEKQFGKGSVMRMGDAGAIPDIEIISTGSLGLDIALGVGGVPKVVHVPQQRHAIHRAGVSLPERGGEDALRRLRFTANRIRDLLHLWNELLLGTIEHGGRQSFRCVFKNFRGQFRFRYQTESRWRKVQHNGVLGRQQRAGKS